MPGASWAHLRRYFFDARHHHPEEARAAMRLARDLFAIEASIRGSPPEVVKEVRARDSTPLVDAFFDFARGCVPRLRPKSELATAVRYALAHEAKFRRFLERPELPMDNNLSELQLRQPVVGRKAWLFAGSEGGAHAAATMFSLVGSCVLQGVDPQAYLVDVLDRIQDHPANRAAELTPLNWRRVQDGLPLLG